MRVRVVNRLSSCDSTPPPFFPVTTNDFTSLFRAVDVPGTDIISTLIPVEAGDVIGVLGSRGNVNSYASGPVNFTFLGTAVILQRLGMQHVLSTTAAQDLWAENPGSISRVEIYVSPMAISTQMLAPATQNTAYTPLQLNAVGGTGSYSWLASGLPPGMSVTPTGSLMGTPTSAGNFTINLQATDTSAPTPLTATIQLQLVVEPSLTLTMNRPGF